MSLSNYFKSKATLERKSNETVEKIHTTVKKTMEKWAKQEGIDVRMLYGEASFGSYEDKASIRYYKDFDKVDIEGSTMSVRLDDSAFFSSYPENGGLGCDVVYKGHYMEGTRLDLIEKNNFLETVLKCAKKMSIDRELVKWAMKRKEIEDYFDKKAIPDSMKNKEFQNNIKNVVKKGFKTLPETEKTKN